MTRYERFELVPHRTGALAAEGSQCRQDDNLTQVNYPADNIRLPWYAIDLPAGTDDRRDVVFSMILNIE